MPKREIIETINDNTGITIRPSDWPLSPPGNYEIRSTKTANPGESELSITVYEGESPQPVPYSSIGGVIGEGTRLRIGTEVLTLKKQFEWTLTGSTGNGIGSWDPAGYAGNGNIPVLSGPNNTYILIDHILNKPVDLLLEFGLIKERPLYNPDTEPNGYFDFRGRNQPTQIPDIFKSGGSRALLNVSYVNILNNEVNKITYDAWKGNGYLNYLVNEQYEIIPNTDDAPEIVKRFHSGNVFFVYGVDSNSGAETSDRLTPQRDNRYFTPNSPNGETLQLFGSTWTPFDIAVRPAGASYQSVLGWEDSTTLERWYYVQNTWGYLEQLVIPQPVNPETMKFTEVASLKVFENSLENNLPASSTVNFAVGDDYPLYQDISRLLGVGKGITDYPAYNASQFQDADTPKSNPKFVSYNEAFKVGSGGVEINGINNSQINPISQITTSKQIIDQYTEFRNLTFNYLFGFTRQIGGEQNRLQANSLTEYNPLNNPDELFITGFPNAPNRELYPTGTFRQTITPQNIPVINSDGTIQDFDDREKWPTEIQFDLKTLGIFYGGLYTYFGNVPTIDGPNNNQEATTTTRGYIYFRTSLQAGLNTFLKQIVPDGLFTDEDYPKDARIYSGLTISFTGTPRLIIDNPTATPVQIREFLEEEAETQVQLLDGPVLFFPRVESGILFPTIQTGVGEQSVRRSLSYSLSLSPEISQTLEIERTLEFTTLFQNLIPRNSIVAIVELLYPPIAGATPIWAELLDEVASESFSEGNLVGVIRATWLINDIPEAVSLAQLVRDRSGRVFDIVGIARVPDNPGKLSITGEHTLGL